MNIDITTGIERLLDSTASVRIPGVWLRAMPNYTDAVLLADILSSYLRISERQGQETPLMDGDELLLAYKHLAQRLGLSCRSVSRAVDRLVRLSALRRSRRDRVVNGKLTRNVVGVVPDLAGIAKLSGISLGDILAARIADPTAPRTETRVTPTDFQESLLRGYAWRFEEVVGAPYHVTPAQALDDRKAAARITISNEPNAERTYYVRAQQYLKARKRAVEKEHGDKASTVAFGRHASVIGSFTFDAFAEWAITNDVPPRRLGRRTFR